MLLLALLGGGCANQPEIKQRHELINQQIEKAEQERLQKIEADRNAKIETNRKTFEAIKAKAEKGDAVAQFELARCYVLSIGVKEDQVEAFKWSLKSAEQGCIEAEIIVGLSYLNGFEIGYGVEKNYAQASKWCLKAAEQGSELGQCYLGGLYQFGMGVPQNFIEAYKWYNLAAAQGNTNAIRSRNVIITFMTPEQIAEGQRRADAFVPHKKLPGSSSDNPALPDNPFASGSGFFITDDGYLISNYHVVKDAAKVRLVTSAGLIDAKVVKVDAANDLALLKADGQFASVPIVSSRTAHLGNSVVAVGFPNIGIQGFAPKFARGEIASLSGAADDARYFQISVPVQPGNSGGALVDVHGNVVGVVSAKLNASAALAASGALPENVNYAVKSSFLLSFLESVPDVASKLKEPNTKDEKFDEVVQSAQAAAVLV